MSKSKPKKFKNTDKYYEISANITHYRRLAGMTQGQLAEKVDLSQPYREYETFSVNSVLKGLL